MINSMSPLPPKASAATTDPGPTLAEKMDWGGPPGCAGLREKDIHAVGCNTGDGHGGVVAEEHFAHSEAIHGRDAAIVRAAPIERAVCRAKGHAVGPGGLVDDDPVGPAVVY